MQFWDILGQPFIQRLLTELFELTFDSWERDVPNFFDKYLVRLEKHCYCQEQNYKLFKSSKMKLKKLVFLIYILIVCQSIPYKCRQYNGSEINGSNLMYTSANMIKSSEQATVINIYGNLTTINGYRIDIEYKIYTNKLSFCDKNDTSIKAINSKTDIWLCFDSFYLLTCNQLWELIIKCGTFVEVHRPFDSQVLLSLNLEYVSWIIDQKGLQIINMDLATLCAGMYHLWFVYYSRMGKFLKGVKTIYITYPSCQC